MTRFAGAFLFALRLAAAGSAVADSSEVTSVIPSVDVRPATPSVAERIAIIRERI
jgi:hypothetical protein